MGMRKWKRDVRGLGLRAALQWRAPGGAPVVALDVRDYGRVYVRRGDTDLGVLRDTIGDRAYDVGAKAVQAALQARYEAILREGRTPVIVDAGANIGGATLWFQRAYPQAALVAIEPDAGTAEILRRNVGESAVVLEAAVGAKPGFVSVSNSGAAVAVTTERAESGCRIVTIDEAAAEVVGGELFIVKVDIEGFESDLFSENLGWIDRSAAVFVEPHDWLFAGRGTSRSFQTAMGARDFELIIRGENLLYVNRDIYRAA
jgi:FkbM family methyltransferase